jgi:hypothetical protein
VKFPRFRIRTLMILVALAALLFGSTAFLIDALVNNPGTKPAARKGRLDHPPHSQQRPARKDLP